MKPINSIIALALLAALPAGSSFAQSSPSSAAKTTTSTTTKTTSSAAAASPAAATTSAAPARTDVYHVHFTHAAPGKANALGDFMKQPDPNAPMPGHSIRASR